MELTKYLKDKLLKLNDYFTHNGEEFKMSSYGGNGNNSYAYWGGDKGTTIEMRYSMNKVGRDSYKGIKDVFSIEIY